MAHFDMTLSDFISDNSIFSKVVENQKNYTPTGQEKAIVTSESRETTPKKGLTTANISDILQNQLLFKDEGLTKTKFNEVLSNDMSTLLSLSINGQNANFSRATASLTAYDVALKSKPGQVLLESFNGLTSSVSGAGNANVSTQARPTPSGFVFPLQTTKSVVRRGLNGISWPSENPNNVHHSYNAADIFAEPGTIVVAAMGGKVVSANNNGGEYGANLRIQGQDGYWYYYTHMGSGTVSVTLNQQVVAGTILGKVGTSSEAQGTTPHLHFDISPQDNGFARGYGFANGPLINPQPWLVEAFQLLPE